jgi:hypothetical protein
MKTKAILIIVALISFGSGVTAQNVYNDVQSDFWAASAIDWVTQKGIMVGPAGPESIFDPAGVVNRAQLATVVTRAYSTIEADLQQLELRIAQLEYEGFLVEQLLQNGSKNLQ